MTKSRLFRTGAMPATDVARIGYDGWKRGEVLIVPGVKNQAATALVRVSPRFVVRRVLKYLNT